MFRKREITAGEVRKLAVSAGISIVDLARALDMSDQTFYRKKDHESFSPKSSRKLLEFFEGLKVKAAV